jgi:hypothetical protein
VSVATVRALHRQLQRRQRCRAEPS